jgi:hypothetical protein
MLVLPGGEPLYHIPSHSVDIFLVILIRPSARPAIRPAMRRMPLDHSSDDVTHSPRERV